MIEHATYWFENLVISNKIIKVGRLSGKDSILNVQDKEQVRKGNKKRKTLKITTCKRETEEHQLKSENMWMK